MPFNKGDIAQIFESGSTFDIALMVEVIVGGSVDRNELL